jgi:hypothetical protein
MLIAARELKVGDLVAMSYPAPWVEVIAVRKREGVVRFKLTGDAVWRTVTPLHGMRRK